eukprot:c14949_g1_i1.p1 GENE.c14949_g1_i1~~c14949_g1_i1.p1  ORF type:complete len:239 (+),score=56.76 c14949_g1_i1:188-904(+)
MSQPQQRSEHAEPTMPISPKELSARDRAWEKDDARTTCSLCGDRFNLVNRKHHCRLCGSLICASCSVFITIDPSASPTAKRVCRDCSDLHQHAPDHQHHHQQNLHRLSHPPAPIENNTQTRHLKSSSVRVFENNRWEPRILELRGDEIRVSSDTLPATRMLFRQRVIKIKGSELRTRLTEDDAIAAEKHEKDAHFFTVLPPDGTPALFIAVDSVSELNNWVFHICEASNEIHEELTQQ